jgi:hypothetical protein
MSDDPHQVRLCTHESAPRRPRFAFQWLIRPSPALARDRKLAELAFRWLGALALALATGLSGRAPRAVERLATHLTR